MPTNSGHFLFRSGPRKGQKRVLHERDGKFSVTAHHPGGGTSSRDFDSRDEAEAFMRGKDRTFTVTYRTRPNGPIVTARITAKSKEDANKIALHRGISHIQSISG